jgi:hypothetical protein
MLKGVVCVVLQTYAWRPRILLAFSSGLRCSILEDVVPRVSKGVDLLEDGQSKEEQLMVCSAPKQPQACGSRLFMISTLLACNLQPTAPMWSSDPAGACLCLVMWANKPSLWLGHNIIGEGCCTPSARARKYCSSQTANALRRWFLYGCLSTRDGGSASSYVAEPPPAKFLAAKWFRLWRVETVMLGIAIDARWDQELICDSVLCYVRVGNCRQLQAAIGCLEITRKSMSCLSATEMMHWVFVRCSTSQGQLPQSQYLITPFTSPVTTLLVSLGCHFVVIIAESLALILCHILQVFQSQKQTNPPESPLETMPPSGETSTSIA